MTGLGSSCGACKFLRRKCTSECVFAPYFCYEEAATHFAAVHKIFGASNVSKLLLQLPVHNRCDAAITIAYEALARMHDPVYGCVAHIFALQQQVANLQEEIEVLGNQMANLTVGNASCGNFLADKNSYTGSHFSLQHDYVNTDNYQNEYCPSLSNTGIAAANQPFIQMDMQLSPLCEWEVEDIFSDFNLNSLEKLLEGVGNENFSCYPWLESNVIAQN